MNKNNKLNIIDFILYSQIYMLGVASTFSLPISFFVGFPAYQFIAIILFASVACILFKEVLEGKARLQIKNVILAILFFSAFAMAAASSLFFRSTGEVFIVLMGYLVFMAPLYMLTFTSFFKSKFSIIGYLKLNTFFALVIGLLSLYQLFFDPLMFKMYAGTDFESLENWASMRSASIMGSIQVYSAYMAFSFWAVVFMRPFSFAGLNIIYAILIGFLGLTGGSQVFILIVLLSLLFLQAKLVLLVLISILLAFYSGLFHLLMDGGPLARFDLVGDNVAASIDNLNQSRVEIWDKAVDLTHPIWGNGLGSASVALEGAQRFNTESYFLNIYYEGGLVFLLPILSFIVIYLWSNRLTVNSNINPAYAFMFIFLVYGISVHVYFSVSLFLVWFLFFFIKKYPNRPLKKCTPKPSRPYRVAFQ